ncbi:hypothetical protein C8Q74DRAFT_1209517 [Fomes fomentarius]|nr:hypothetical protein C8Q74DRAFT_1209517 [Fomes fomentarius]
MHYWDRCIGWQRTLCQHEEDSSMHHVCEDCGKVFASAFALKKHYVRSPLHPYCRVCDELYEDWEDLYEHYDTVHYYCDDCNQVFQSDLGLHEHHIQRHSDVYCALCEHMFKDNNAFRHHERSTPHQGRTVHCPMQRCKKFFVSRAALVQHLESGACPSSITRDEVNRIVSSLDEGGIITSCARPIGGPSSESSSAVIETWATERAWNGKHYECYVCHRTFASLPALNQHLSSPAHTEKLYHCPTVLKGCEAEFRTLSGFCQHVESESCGVHRFKKTMDKFIDGLPQGKRLLV